MGKKSEDHTEHPEKYVGKPIEPEYVDEMSKDFKMPTVEQKEEEESFGTADWPDSAFAYVPPEAKGADGNKSARKLPYKTKDGKVDLPHLRNALARFNQADIPSGEKHKVLLKLCRAAKQAGIESEFCKEKTAFEAAMEDITAASKKLDG